jgi:hypothetical protein
MGLYEHQIIDDENTKQSWTCIHVSSGLTVGVIDIRRKMMGDNINDIKGTSLQLSHH